MAIDYPYTVANEDGSTTKFFEDGAEITTLPDGETTTTPAPEEEVTKFALQGKYPIHTPEHIKKAQFWFEGNYQILNIDDTLEFISNLSREASEQGVQLEKTAA